MIFQSTPALKTSWSPCTYLDREFRSNVCVVVMIEFIKQGGVTVDEVLEVADPGIHAGNAGLAAALAPRNESDHVPTSRSAFANKGSAAVAFASILAVSTSAYFGSVRGWFCNQLMRHT